MSKEDNRGMIDAYQQMLQDGTAFKEVDTSMLTSPSMSEAEGAGAGEHIKSEPLGDKIETPDGEEYHNDYSDYDSVMEQRINKFRQKTSGAGTGKLERKGKSRLVMLEKKVAQLEQAMMLIMETHEQLLDG